MSKRRFAPAIVYAFLLLFAQQSAFMHAAWHASDHAPAQHKNNGDASFQGKLCGLHGAFSQVLGGVQPSVAQQPLARCANEVLDDPPRAVIVPELHVPLSRGPPSYS